MGSNLSTILTRIAVGLLRLSAILPYKIQLAIGKGIGNLLYLFIKRRRMIATTNIQLAFPKLSAKEQKRLCKKHFQSLGIGLIEFAISWWGTDQQLKKLSTINGAEHLQQAFDKGKGVILLSGHFTTLEIAGHILGMEFPLHVLYRTNENPTLEKFLHQGRNRRAAKTLAREDMRGMIRALKSGGIVWYAPDQNYGHKGSVFADFFSIPAATNTATARLAKMTGAAVVPFFTTREQSGGYTLTISPALDEFPSDDSVADASVINKLIEDAVLNAPEQYLWIHRRYKDRPNNEASFYS